ncbi:MAG: hypothetical protein HYU69_13815 [Bacteroidetes bacterium]|nr:hypothetical protein [Bacteroidota bacterium]
MNHKQFYKEFGHLLYAIASSDGKVRRKEVEALREFVLKELTPFELTSDSSGMNQAFYTQFEFDDMADKHIPASEVFMSFVQYLKSNAPLINEQLKNSIIKAVEKVAHAYKKTNKLEQEMVDKLKEEIEVL